MCRSRQALVWPTLLCLAILVFRPVAAVQSAAAAPALVPESTDDGWPVASPSEAGFDPAALAQLADEIEAGTAYPNVHAVLVEHAGRLVFERYFAGMDHRNGLPTGIVEFDRDTLHNLNSISKNITTAILGIALGAGFEAAIERPVATYFPDLATQISAGARQVTLRHALTMTAGLEWNEQQVPYASAENHWRQMLLAADPVGFVLKRHALYGPGIRWTYHTGLTQVLAGVTQAHTGRPFEAFAQERLFAPLGITRHEWRRPASWSDAEPPDAGAGLRLRARDIAKLGSVYLHGGKWRDRQIVPAGWVELSVRRHVRHIPWGRTLGIFGYGFMWYPGVWGAEGRAVIRASGYAGQWMFIVPDAETVVTVLSGNYADGRADRGQQLFARIMATRVTVR